MLNTDKQTEINLGLWKQFNDDADKTKDRMWTIASWMFTLQAGLLAFIGKYWSENPESKFKIANPVIAIATGVGIILCIYSIYMISQYGYHINSMWNRANIIRRQIPGLSDIWFINNTKKIEDDKNAKDERGLPAISRNLIYLCIVFMVVFIVLLVIAICKNS